MLLFVSRRILIRISMNPSYNGVAVNEPVSSCNRNTTIYSANRTIKFCLHYFREWAQCVDLQRLTEPAGQRPTDRVDLSRGY